MSFDDVLFGEVLRERKIGIFSGCESEETFESSEIHFLSSIAEVFDDEIVFISL